jgi:hypothetical protein
MIPAQQQLRNSHNQTGADKPGGKTEALHGVGTSVHGRGPGSPDIPDALQRKYRNAGLALDQFLIRSDGISSRFGASGEQQ